MMTKTVTVKKCPNNNTLLNFAFAILFTCSKYTPPVRIQMLLFVIYARTKVRTCQHRLQLIFQKISDTMNYEYTAN